MINLSLRKAPCKPPSYTEPGASPAIEDGVYADALREALL